jgi:long-chain acyl-CoA synthetase
MTKGVLIDTKEGKRVVKGLGYYETPEIENLKQLVKISTEKHGDAIAFRFKDKIGNITGKTYNEFDRDIDCLGPALYSPKQMNPSHMVCWPKVFRILQEKPFCRL